MVDSWHKFSRRQKAALAGWGTFVIGLSLLTLVVMGWEQYAIKRDSLAAQTFHLTSSGHLEELAEPEIAPPPGHERDVPRQVKAGIYLDRVPELSILDSYWKADFYIWFSWEGEPDFNPGESFHVNSGEILVKSLIEKQDDGKRHYALYRVTAQITKVFDVSRFPRNDHLLMIEVEDGGRQAYQLRYVTDPNESGISDRVSFPGFKIVENRVAVRTHSYKTNRGNPKLPANFKSTYSQLVYAVWIARPTWSLHFRMFVVMYGAALVAMLGLFVKSSADRLAVVSGALFAAVANMYITSTVIPDTGIATLADHINWIGAACIMLIILQAVIYQLYLEGREEKQEFARFFDGMSFVLILSMYTVLNLVIPELASI